MRLAPVAFALAALAASPALAEDKVFACYGDDEYKRTDVITLNEADRTWTLLEVFEDTQATIVFTHGYRGALECRGDADMCRQLVGAEPKPVDVTVEIEDDRARLTLVADDQSSFTVDLDMNTAVVTMAGEAISCQQGYP